MLGAQERAQVAQVWALTARQEARFRAELWLRCLFTVHPRTKASFPHLGACLHELQLVSHEPRTLAAVGAAVQHTDNLRAALSPAHAALRVDPANFETPSHWPRLRQLLIQCFQVVLFTVEMHAEWDKFLNGVAVVLTEKYL
uniref:Hemoglobin subunit mu n=1 Tax=Propithecus coquereli TaxID=379532 RepID=A0A2K6G6F9_PROCO